MMTNEQYHADTSRISKSGLDLINQAPAKYYHRYLDPNAKPRKSTKTFDFGSSMHSIINEREKFDQEFIVSPNFTGEGSKFKREMFAAANKDKTVISAEMFDHITGMRKSVFNHPIASKLLSHGVAEQTFTWIDPETGAPCKCRPDWWNDDKRYIIDLKSTPDARQNPFMRSAFKYRYHVQAPFYFDGLEANGMKPKRFVFIAVEKEPPYLVNVFFYPETEMEFGRQIYRENLETYMECKRTGIWNGYTNEIKPLEIPGAY